MNAVRSCRSAVLPALRDLIPGTGLGNSMISTWGERSLNTTTSFAQKINIAKDTIVNGSNDQEAEGSWKRTISPNTKHGMSFASSSSGLKNPKPCNNGFVKGEVLDLGIDIHSLRPGDKIDIPYELTVSESMHDFWQSAFHSQDRVSTSTPFARRIGLQDRVLPFSFMLFLTSAMTHADAARVQVGLDNAIYHWPAFAGDTFKKSYVVKSIRNTSDGNHSIIHYACSLINQRDRVCMTTDRRTMYNHTLFESPSSSPPILNDPATTSQLFRDHLLSKATILQEELKSHSLISLKPNQLIRHTMNRGLTFSQSQQLASLARITHEKHFDTKKYNVSTEILVPGGLVVGLAMSSSARDLHEILMEEVECVTFVNAVHPGNVVGSVTFVKSVDDMNLLGDLELLEVRTIGVKDMDVVRDLEGVDLPLELFCSKDLMTKDIERICKEKCPILSKKIVVLLDRKIIRQASRRDVFLL